jgi:hypothetical protein
MQNELRAPGSSSSARLARLGGTALAIAGAIGAGRSASAALIGLPPNVASGTWTYNVNLSGGSQVQNGDEFIIYDFGGYVGSSIAAPAGWTATAQLLTPPPPGVVLTNPDDPLTSNLLFVRNGGTVINGGSSDIGLGSFSAGTSFTDTALDTFAYQDHTNANPNGPPGTGQAPISVPSLGGIPEPATIGVLAGGLTLLTLRRRSRIE